MVKKFYKRLQCIKWSFCITYVLQCLTAIDTGVKSYKILQQNIEYKLIVDYYALNEISIKSIMLEMSEEYNDIFAICCFFAFVYLYHKHVLEVKTRLQAKIRE